MTRTSAPICSTVGRTSVRGSAQAPEPLRTRSGKRRGDEEHDLVHETVRDERGRKRRAPFEEERLHALPRKPFQLLPERAAEELELGALRQRPAAECESPRLSLGADVACGQVGLVGTHRAHSHRDRVHLRAQLVHTPPALLAGHPARSGHRDAAVERDRGLVDDERTSFRHPDAEALILRPRPPFELPARKVHLDPGGAEALEARAVGLGIGVTDGRDDPAHTRLDERVRAGRRAAVVGAGLERDEERRAARARACRLQRDDLGVRAARPLVPALPDDLAVPYEHGSHDRVRRGRSTPSLSQLERALEPCGLTHPARACGRADGRPD